jgi:CRISPR-associated protein Cas2
MTNDSNRCGGLPCRIEGTSHAMAAGDLTRCFIGRVSARVRDLMWSRVLELVKNGRAIMVYSADNEQGLAFKVHEHNWIPVDHEGVNLMLRPTLESGQVSDSFSKSGWSNASKFRRYGRRKS